MCVEKAGILCYRQRHCQRVSFEEASTTAVEVIVDINNIDFSLLRKSKNIYWNYMY